MADDGPNELEQADTSDCVWSSAISLSNKSPSATNVVPEDVGLDFDDVDHVDSGSTMPKLPKLSDRRRRRNGAMRDCKAIGRSPITAEMRLSDVSNSKLFTGKTGIAGCVETDMIRDKQAPTSHVRSKQRAVGKRLKSDLSEGIKKSHGPDIRGLESCLPGVENFHMVKTVGAYRRR